MNESTPSAPDPIKHIVVLMLENHSFDQMLGSLKKVYPQLDGVDSAHPHANEDDAGTSFQQSATTERQMLLDPHHEVDHVAVQLEGQNSGFVKDYADSFPQSTAQERQYIMGYYPLDFLPSLHALAREFTICDAWFSSLPGPTWPNRFFALAGTSCGLVSMPGDKAFTDGDWFNQDQDTIFDRLNEKGIHWKCYFHDIPQSWVLSHQRRLENVARYFYINRFHQDARGLADDFPQFCFIEPGFMGFDENDDHPPHDIMKAEKLIADIYNSLRANPDLWASTLLVIFYDEHGGFFDHVVPPKAVPPGNLPPQPEYTFDQLGLRVPALLVSPWVKKGVEHTQFDHTSLLKYLTEKWGLRPLGERTKQATSLGVALSGNNILRTDTIERIDLTADQLAPPNPDMAEKAGQMVTAHHLALQAMEPYLKMKAEETLPRILIVFARAVESVKSLFDGQNTSLIISPSQPDHVSGKQGKQARLHQTTARFLGTQKMKSISVLAQAVRNPNLPQAQREHAVRTLASLTGRKFHHEPDKVSSADAWLKYYHR